MPLSALSSVFVHTKLAVGGAVPEMLGPTVGSGGTPAPTGLKVGV